jgi:hypothetical protein
VEAGDQKRRVEHVRLFLNLLPSPPLLALAATPVSRVTTIAVAGLTQSQSNQHPSHCIESLHAAHRSR